MGLKTTIQTAFSHLNTQQRKKIWQWVYITLFGSLLKAFGVVSIMPFVALITEPSLIESSRAFGLLYEFLGSQSYNEFLLKIGMGTILIFLITGAYSFFEVWYGYRLFNHLEQELSIRLFKGYAAQNYHFFLRQNQSEAIRRVTQEIEVGIVDVLMTTVDIISSIFLTLILIAVITYADPWVAFISACILLISHLWVEYYIGHKVVSIGQQFTDLNDGLLNTVSEMFCGIKEVKISGAESRFVKKYAKTYQKLSDYSTRYGVLEYTPREILEAIAYIGIILFSIFAIVFYQSPETVFPLIAMYALAAYRLIPALREIFTGIEKIHLSEYSLSKLTEDFAQIDTLPKEQEANEPMPFNNELLLKNINFSYHATDKKILKQLNIRIKAHSHTLLSGPSGIGKTTLADIIMGLLHPDSGDIYIDEQKLDEKNYSAWKKIIAYVPQNIYLFQGSLAQNVALASHESNIDLERVKQCCQLALLDQEIESLSDGYQTIVGQGNQLLSGGQLKRLGIARALYKNPEFLILDESTNEIETEKKTQILSTLREMGGLTVLIISHDPDIAKLCQYQIKLSQNT